MKQVKFDDLAKLPVVQFYETSFRKATGVSLKVVAPNACGKALAFGPAGSPFCGLVAEAPAGCEACGQAEGRVQARAANTLIPQQIHCFAGLTIVAVPVVLAGQHVATLLSGQVFRREPTERDFVIIAKMLNDGAAADWTRKARRAYFETPVVNAERFQAIVELVKVFAQYLTDYASRHVIASSPVEPDAVAGAKKFVLAHVDEPVTLAQVAGHVHVSPFHLCKVFRKATGMTLTEYVARVRVEKAKSLLVDPSLRISEVVFAAGFGSIPQFNCVFKRYAGMAPTEYRAQLRAPTAG
jgi:AraC-like DNA-binding protein/ligand-binding sensor protein